MRLSKYAGLTLAGFVFAGAAVAAEAPRFNYPRIFGVRPGSPVVFRLPVSGTRPMKFAAEGLPGGVRLDAETGILSGASTVRATNHVVFTVSNAAGSCRQVFRLVVGDEFVLTPPLGFNTFGGLGCGKRMNDQSVRASIRALVDTGLADHGYAYCNVDDGWQGLRGGEYFATQPNAKFRDMRALGEEIHALGLKFGLYSTPYVTSYARFPGCSSLYPDRDTDVKKVPKDVGPYMFDENDANQAGAWGCDYYKYDWKMRIPEWGGKYGRKWTSIELSERMSRFLRAQRRDICFENSHHCDFAYMDRFCNAGNMTRVDGDLMDVWSKTQMPDRPRDLGVRDLWLCMRDTEWRKRNRPGHWNMPCPMRLGMMGGFEGPDHPLHPTRLEPDEQRSHMVLWCLWSSPIIIGAPVDSLDPLALSLFLNDELLALNQDPLGIQAEDFEAGGGEILVKRLEDGDVAVGLFNPSDAPGSVRVTADWSIVGVKGPQAVRDLLNHRDLGTFEGSFSADVPRHGVVVVRLHAVK